MCELLGEPAKNGTSKKAQIKTWQRYFGFEKVEGSQKMIITDIFQEPKEKIDKRNDGIYVKSIELVLLNELAKHKSCTITLTKNMLLQKLGMINNNYRRISNEKLKLIDTCITDFEINHFYQRANSRLTGILLSALNSLKKRFIIEYSIQYVIVDGSGNRRIADDIDLKNIITLKHRVAHTLGCKDEKEVFLKMKTAEFYKKLNEQYYYYFKWQYVYQRYKIIYNNKIVVEEIPNAEAKLQKELLNNKVINALEHGATQNYTTSKVKLPDTYKQAQSLLTDALINQKTKVTKEYMYVPTRKEEDELNSIFGF